MLRATLRDSSFWYGCIVSAALAVGHGPGVVCAENWPAWRGPTHDGVCRESNVPDQWSAESNVAWKVDLPEPGNSTPIVWGDRVFLTQPEGPLRSIVCYRQSDGQELWKRGVTFTDDEPTHRTNYYCSPSPVTDGERVVAWFGSAGVWAGDLDGNELWRVDLGPQTHEWGVGLSPVLTDDLCIVQCGAGEREFLTGMDKRTGKIKWQVDTPAGSPDEIGEVGPEGQDESGRRNSQTLRGAWGTPKLVSTEARQLLIVTSPLRVSGYDADTGQLVWTCRGVGPLVYASPTVANDRVIALGGYHSGSVAVRLGGAGDVTETHRLWHQPRSPLWLGSGVVVGDHFFVQDLKGILNCISLDDYQIVQRRRLGSSDGGASWSSPVRVDDRLYFLNQAGDVFIVRADPELEIMATNRLQESTNASLAISQGHVFIRTHQRLWSIGE